MNFLNRKMFAEGGQSSVLGDYDIFDKSTNKITKVNPGFLQNITAKAQYAYPLLNGYKAGQIQLGQGVLQELEAFRQVDEPFGISGDLSSDTRIDDLGTAAFDLSRGFLRGAEGPLRGIAGFAGELVGSNKVGDALKDMSSFDFRNMKRKEYDPIFPTREENRSQLLQEITNRELGEVQDFSKEIAAIENPQIEEVAPIDAVESIDPIKQIEDIEPIPDPTFTPRTESDTLGQGYQPGSVGYEELEGRRLAYEKSLIGVDQFGDPIERPEDIDDEIASLIRETLPAEQTVDIERSEADSLMDVENKFSGLSADELQIELEKSNIPAFEMPEPELVKVDTTTVSEEATGNKDDSIERKLQEPGFFGSDRFLDFIRNVGGELVRTGQFGEGLASGAAKAAEERAARELMAAQENRKFQDAIKLEMAKNALEGKVGMKPTDAAKISEYEQLLATDIAGFDKNKNSLSNLNTVISILDEGGATGIKGFFGEATDMIQAAIKSDTGKSFEELNPRTRANALLKVLRQANVREILGESGKTISNLDRSIVEDVFGDIKLGTPLAVSLEKLKDSRQNMVNGLIQKQNQIISYSSFFNNVGYSSAVLSINQPLIDLIRSFNFENAESYIAGKNSPGYTEADL
jgi:hypothetical protein